MLAALQLLRQCHRRNLSGALAVGTMSQARQRMKTSPTNLVQSLKARLPMRRL